MDTECVPALVQEKFHFISNHIAHNVHKVFPSGPQIYLGFLNKD